MSVICRFENKVIKLVNCKRAKMDLKPLVRNYELAKIARLKSQDLVDNNYFSHRSPTYGSPFDMISNFGITYSIAGENIAFGQITPSEVMKAWMKSKGHRSNILNSSFTEIGVGVVVDEHGRYYWTQMFIGN
ncbi:hypothetical protein SH2C18_48080 [Clostridium sediminicola]|uniref:CAP domain-containing protein n=1 Tax=Clostridium sediminicola TaxID=3114879 RepID=UPI0031F1C514